MLPKDPVILLSVVNTKLRDYYKNLDDLCENEGILKKDLIESLNKINYEYSIDQNQFI